MEQHLNSFRSSFNWRQISVGSAALFIGLLLYLVDRPPDQIYFIRNLDLRISLYNILPNIFGTAGNFLPTLIHVFSFILITAGLINCGKRGNLIICGVWFIIDTAFEFGQKFHLLTVKIIPHWFADIPIIGNTKNYFLQGTFDPHDIASIALGAVMAYLVLLLLDKEVIPCKVQSGNL